jgi:outer membrane receptor protein involved in Fe transport
LTLINEDESWKAETQFMSSRDKYDLLLGGSYFEADSHENLVLAGIPLIDDSSSPSHINAYGYFYLDFPAGWPQVQVGVSYDDLSAGFGEQSEFNPKVGVTWSISDSVTLRAAGFRIVTRSINSDQGLEPTQIAGFNQFFDDQNGTESESGGLAADFRISPTVFAGLEVSRRDLKVPFTDASTGEVFFADRRDDTASGHLYWLPSERLSVSLEPRFHDFDHGIAFDSMELTEIPLSVKFVLPSGLWTGISVTGVEQSGDFDAPDGSVAAGSDSFVLVDAIIAYRLPRRRGTISLEGTNLFNEEFRFQEIDQEVLPRYVPEAQYFLRASFNF